MLGVAIAYTSIDMLFLSLMLVIAGDIGRIARKLDESLEHRVKVAKQLPSSDLDFPFTRRFTSLQEWKTFTKQLSEQFPCESSQHPFLGYSGGSPSIYPAIVEFDNEYGWITAKIVDFEEKG